MAANPVSERLNARSPARADGKTIADLAAAALSDIATLFHAELQLLRAELSEKLTFTGLSAALVGVGALLLMATIVLVLQAAIAGLVAYGFSWSVAILIVAGFSLLVGVGCVWVGLSRLSIERLAPSKTLDQLRKDAGITNIR